ncbi:alpha/beta fold hydrolase [Psychrobacter celer]|uniref:alpha/beta fold hydrolase n=1 Tax=Psychrobacter celer TaxID=306572 RepID=UPI003FD28F2D
MQVIDSGKGKTIEAFGLQTNYLEMGEGEPLLLLHGSGPGVSAYTNWRKIIPELAKQFRVIAPDLAGFGHTERDPNFSYDIKHWGKHLLAFLDALGIEKTHVIGNSFGGSLTLATAARFPERFSKLCLMGTPCDKFFMTPGLRSGWDYTPSRENMRQAMSHFPHNPDTITDELVEERYKTSLIPGAQEGLRKLLVQPNEEGETQLSGMPEHVVAKINHPAIVIHGREDKVVPTEMGFKLGRSMPNADLHVLANCGHWVMAERPKEFLQLVINHFTAE